MLHFLTHFARNRQGSARLTVVLFCEVCGQYHEFVAAQAGHGIFLAQQCAQAAGDVHQEFVEDEQVVANPVECFT